jgi:hypothetical protein
MRGSSALRAFSMGMFIAAAILWGVHTYDREQTAVPPASPSLTKEMVDQYLHDQGYLAISKDEYKKLVDQAADIKELKQPKPAPPSPPKTFIIEIKQGAASKDVATLLEQKGVIKSGAEFEQYLTDANLTSKLRVGTYELTQDMPFNEIANILTKRTRNK